MVTQLYLLAEASDEPKPNVRQSTTTIEQWVASTLGGGQDGGSVIYPLKMRTSKGPATNSINQSITELGAAHEAWFKAWVSAKLNGDQTISGTVTLVIDFNEGNAAHNMFPFVRIYVWKGDDSGVRGTLLADYQWTTPESDATDGTKQTWAAVTLTSVNALNGDRIVIEIFVKDDNTKSVAYAHKINFADSGTASDSYIEFSQDINFQAEVILKEVTDAFGLIDSVLRDKTFEVTDSMGLSDLPLSDKTFAISDSFGLIDEVALSKLKEVLDSFGLSDVVLTNKTPLSISDSIGLTDTILANKNLQITDTLGLSELVEVLGAAILKEVLDSMGMSDEVKVYLGTYYDKPVIILDIGGLGIPIFKKERAER